MHAVASVAAFEVAGVTGKMVVELAGRWFEVAAAAAVVVQQSSHRQF